MKIQARVLSLLLGAIGLACAPAAFSQATQQPSAELSGSSFSDSELASFALAVIEVQRITDTYLPKLESARSPEEQQQIRQAASQEMVRAVETKGMSVEKYKKLVGEARVNPAIADRVKEHIKDHGQLNADR